MLELIANDKEVVGIVSCQFIKAAEAEQQILKAVAGMLLQHWAGPLAAIGRSLGGCGSKDTSQEKTDETDRRQVKQSRANAKLYDCITAEYTSQGICIGDRKKAPLLDTISLGPFRGIDICIASSNQKFVSVHDLHLTSQSQQQHTTQSRVWNPNEGSI